MNLTEFQEYVSRNVEWFQGEAHETPESIAMVEHRLGLPLPNALAWLLTEWGYGRVGTVPNLQESIDDTLRLRANLQLPQNLVLLCDWGDAGVVWIDLDGSDDGGQVFWGSAGDLELLCENQVLGEDVDRFENFAAWAKSQCESYKASEGFP